MPILEALQTSVDFSSQVSILDRTHKPSLSAGPLDTRSFRTPSFSPSPSPSTTSFASPSQRMAAARRDVTRDRGERDENAPRKQPAKTNDLPRRTDKPDLNEYFIDEEEGINREVLQKEICKYLGAEATCRPGEYKGHSGFKIWALRPFTPSMLDDLRLASKAFVKENNAYQKRFDRGNTSSMSPSPAPATKFGSIWLTPPPDLAYENSQTFKSNDPVELPEKNVYPGRNSPSYNGASAYGPPGQNGFPVSSAAYSGPSTYAVHPGVPASSPMPTDSRYPPPEHYYPPPPPSRDARDGPSSDYYVPRGGESRDPRDPRNNAVFGNNAPYPPGSYSEQYAHSGYDNPNLYRTTPVPRGGGGDARMTSDYYANGGGPGGNSGNGGGPYPQNGRDPRDLRDSRAPEYYDQMQGVTGPNAYSARMGGPAMSPQYDNPGRQDPYRAGVQDRGFHR